MNTRNTRNVGPGGLGCLGIILLLVGLVLAEAWVIMVVWGALASHFDFKTIGLGTAALVGLALTIVFGGVSRY